MVSAAYSNITDKIRGTFIDPRGEVVVQQLQCKEGRYKLSMKVIGSIKSSINRYQANIRNAKKIKILLGELQRKRETEGCMR